MRKRLARRFSVVGEAHGFKILIDGHPISTADRGDLPMVQFLWSFGDEEPDLSSAGQLLEREALSDRLDAWDGDWSVTGWIGTARLPKQLDSDDAGNLNSIVVFARGRLFHENILDKLNDGRLYTKYLTGQIEADFLDADDEPDIATSDRQRVQEDDPRYVQLIAFLRATHAGRETLDGMAATPRGGKGQGDVTGLAEWLESLPEGFRKAPKPRSRAQCVARRPDETGSSCIDTHPGVRAHEIGARPKNWPRMSMT